MSVIFLLSLADHWVLFSPLELASCELSCFCMWMLSVDSWDRKHLFGSPGKSSLPFWRSLPVSFLYDCTLSWSPGLCTALGMCRCTAGPLVGYEGRASFPFPGTRSTCMHLLWLTCPTPSPATARPAGGPVPLLCAKGQQHQRLWQADSVLPDLSMPAGFIKHIQMAPVPSWRPAFGNGGRVWRVWELAQRTQTVWSGGSGF